MFIMGLDIGYSNLKIAYGESQDNKPKTIVLPAGAVPKEFLPMSIKKNNNSRYFVNINNETYVTGVELSMIEEGWNRELHEDYPFTDSYKALFYTALLFSGREKVDLLITGLPVSQFLNKDFRDKLKRTLEGKHKITKAKTVTVENVMIVAQPMGAYLTTFIESPKEDLSLIEARTLVFDVGFFSVDWVLIDNQNIIRSSSGTSVLATSWLLERAKEIIEEEHGHCPRVEKLETALRKNNGNIYIFAEKVNLYPYLNKVIEKYKNNIAAELKRSFRFQKSEIINNIILTGGGGKFYKQIAPIIGDKANIIEPEDIITANARGFWYFAKLD